MVHNKEKLNVRIVELDNKSRKGTYIYIKEFKKPGRYYKFQEGTQVDDYLSVYKGSKAPTTISKRKGFVQKEVRRVKKAKKIESNLVQGKNVVVINDFTGKSKESLNQYRKNLLKPMVRDKQLLEILANDENYKKIKRRIEYKVDIIGTNGLILSTFSIFNMEANLFESKIKKAITKGMVLENKSPNTFRDSVSFHFNKKPMIVHEGVLNQARVHVIFRKGK